MVAALAAGELSSRELLAALAEQVDRHNPAVNAVVTLDLDGARQAADRADADRADAARSPGRPPGRLAGLPMTVKDAIETAGLRSTGGAVDLAHHVPAADAPAVARLREAGAVVFGKTNLPTWSADAQTSNDLFGTTVNPWDAARTAGGSSGGAAVAVATGMTPLELGTDVFGSVRIPAAFCGVYGLKPTYGLVPQRGYLRDRSGGTTVDLPVNAFGPLARTADDLALALSVLAGRRLADLRPPPGRSLAGHRVAVWLDSPHCPVDGEVAEVLRAAADDLADAGARVTECRPPVDPEEALAVLFALVPPAAEPGAAGGVGPRPSRPTGGSDGDAALPARRARLQAAWERWFADVDVLLCPVAPTVAFPHDLRPDRSERVTWVNGRRRPYLDGVGWTGVVGVAHLPAVAAPVGPSRSGLPVGVQVVAPPLGDLVAVGFAGLLAEVCGGFRPPPGVGPVQAPPGFGPVQAPPGVTPAPAPPGGEGRR